MTRALLFFAVVAVATCWPRSTSRADFGMMDSDRLSVVRDTLIAQNKLEERQAAALERIAKAMEAQLAATAAKERACNGRMLP